MTTNGHAHHDGPAAPSPEPSHGASELGQGAPEYLVIVHPAGDLDAPHLLIGDVVEQLVQRRHR